MLVHNLRVESSMARQVSVSPGNRDKSECVFFLPSDMMYSLTFSSPFFGWREKHFCFVVGDEFGLPHGPREDDLAARSGGASNETLASPC